MHMLIFAGAIAKVGKYSVGCDPDDGEPVVEPKDLDGNSS